MGTTFETLHEELVEIELDDDRENDYLDEEVDEYYREWLENLNVGGYIEIETGH